MDKSVDFSSEIIEIDLPGGTRGLQGPIGKTPNLSVGEVTKGTEPIVTITGTDENPVLNITLPKGDKGDSGVWSDDTTPPDDYDVWIIPDGTPGTIPTKVSELNNDLGFIDEDVDSLTNYYKKAEINTLINNVKGTILWSNSQPASEFDAQYIEFEDDDYDMFKIFFSTSINSADTRSIDLLCDGYSNLSCIDEDFYLCSREVNNRIDGKIRIEAAYRKDSSSSTNPTSSDNERCIPLYIVGYKTGLFS